MEAKKVYKEEILFGVRVPSGMWRNFSGATYKYIKGQRPQMISPTGGKRYFEAFLTDEQGRDLQEKGWNVQWTTPREEGDEPQAHIRVNVGFGGRYPIEVYLIQGKTIVELNEDNIATRLEGADFTNVDITIRPYNQTATENGASAYLQQAYFTRRNDLLADKYQEYFDNQNSSDPFDVDMEVPFN